MMQLLQGATTLEQVIQTLPGPAAVHLIASGGVGGSVTAFDPDQVNLVLDAIDDVYDHIVSIGEYAALQNLFALIEGRFDTVVEIAAPDQVHTTRSDTWDIVWLPRG